jgi:hypothetical protein
VEWSLCIIHSLTGFSSFHSLGLSLLYASSFLELTKVRNHKRVSDFFSVTQFVAEPKIQTQPCLILEFILLITAVFSRVLSHTYLSSKNHAVFGEGGQ